MSRNISSPIEKESKRIISERLQKLISRKKLPQATIAKQLKFSAATMSNYVSGKRLPSPENIEKLAKYFGIKPEELDPRFNTPSTLEEKHYPKKVDLKELEDKHIAISYGGKDLTDEDLKIIKAILKRNDLLENE
ncbi:helix-turn-helix transcriptional regulator [Lactobacillus sp. PV037]|uniref:helix-turn-helix domain-containing protein n=1 Tax=Lactobacillus sp. PV037 TaxID=2594496 RepID=UPI0022402C53|nr:helix-turn-helix transcriptional regulator [Lactobacillus sp. PV037]QNQ83810.1 helix-turn-helix transcriptional regulator [Lactobacillus sp. PV037]